MSLAGVPITDVHNLPSAEPRVVHEFEVPEEYQSVGGEKVRLVGFHELTLDEERRAATRGGGDQMAMAFELWKEALAEVNGQHVSLGDASTDLWVKRFSAPLRGLCMTAYAEVNTPKEKTTANFLRSR